MIVRLNKRDEKIFTIAAFFPVLANILQYFLYGIYGRSSLIYIATLMASMIIYLLSVVQWSVNKIQKATVLYSIVFIVCLTNYLLYPENRDFGEMGGGYWRILFLLFVRCLPSFLNSYFVTDQELQQKTMLKISHGVFLFGVGAFVFRYMYGVNNDMQDDSEYNMSYSYYMLLPALCYIYQLSKKWSILYFLSVIITLIAMILLGSRGAVISAVIYFVLMILFSLKHRTAKIIIFAAIAIILFVYSEEILNYFAYNILDKFGIESRTLRLFITGELISHDSGRGDIYARAIKSILYHPFYLYPFYPFYPFFLGSGIMSEYRILGQYAHNIFLDLLLQYGILLGSIIIIAMLYLMLKAFIHEKEKSFFCMMLCYGFVPMLVSGTYLTSMPFWIFMGYCLRKKRMKFTAG